MRQRESETDDDFESRIHHIEEMVRDYPDEEEDAEELEYDDSEDED